MAMGKFNISGIISQLPRFCRAALWCVGVLR